MILAALLAVPLVAAALLSRAQGRVATVVHTLAAMATSVLSLAVAAIVIRETSVEAFGGFLRADALSAWMVALVGIVAGLAALEAPHDAHGVATNTANVSRTDQQRFDMDPPSEISSETLRTPRASPRGPHGTARRRPFAPRSTLLRLGPAATTDPGVRESFSCAEPSQLE